MNGWLEGLVWFIFGAAFMLLVLLIVGIYSIT